MNTATKIKTFKNSAAQGDVLFRVVQSIPEGARESKPEGGHHIVAHSETGHHHAVKAAGVAMFEAPGNPLIAYLKLDPGVALDVTHLREHDTHAPLRRKADAKKPVIIEIRRQREHAPEGWRRAVD